MLKVMQEKGLVGRAEGDNARASVWSARVSKAAAGTTMLGRLMDLVFDGSARSLVAHMVESGKLSEDDRAEIRRLLDAGTSAAAERRVADVEEERRAAPMSTSALWLGMGWTMLHFLWVGTVIGGLGAIALRAMRRAAPEQRYGLALATLAMLALAPARDRLASDGGCRPGWGDEACSAITATEGFASALETHRPGLDRPSSPGGVEPDGAGPRMVPATGHVRVEGPGAAGSRLDLAAAWLPWLWVVGSPLTFFWLACGLMGAERLRRRSRLLTDRESAELCGRLALALGITRRVGLAACDRLAAPVLVGILRPLILLPAAAMSGWSPDQLEMVLLHELAHVRRRDNLVNLLQRLVESVLFFHPAVWIVSGWVRREREHCCDRVVVERTGRPRAYVETLLSLSTPAADPASPDRPGDGPRAPGRAGEEDPRARRRPSSDEAPPELAGAGRVPAAGAGRARAAARAASGDEGPG